MPAPSSTSNPPAAERVRDGVEPKIADGAFLADPGVLPRGRHGLTREQVLEVQRERLLIAATELLAAHGYRGFGAGEIAGRAGVSLAAFYDCFENKDACVFAGYDRFIEVLLERMGSVALAGKSRTELVGTLLGAYLETLQSDLVVARAYQVEIDALGPAARERRRSSLHLFAAYIREVVARTAPGGGPPDVLSPSAYIGVVYAARQLASDALDMDAEPDLVGLGDDMRPWLADLFRLR